MQTFPLRCVGIIVLATLVATSDQLGVLSVASRLLADDASQRRAAKPLTAQEEVPADILARARAEGFSVSDIKRAGDQWVACKQSQGAAGGVCIALGASARNSVASARNPRAAVSSVAFSRLVAGDTLLIEQYGQPLRRSQLTTSQVQSGSDRWPVENIGAFERIDRGAFRFVLHAGTEARVSVSGRPDEVVDTLPRYRREADGVVRTKDHSLVKQYIDSHPSESFIVLVTVPTLCEPCRQMDHLLVQADRRASTSHMSIASKPKLFILEYFSFVDAERDVLGRGALFPTTLIYPATTQPRRSMVRMIGDSRGKSIGEVAAPLQGWLKRGVPHTLTRGIVSPDTLYTLAQ